MMYLEEAVELAGSCYYNMLRSVVEALDRETTGDLLGKRIKENFICLNAYPITTANRKPKSVSYDDEAVKRVRDLNKVVNTLGGLGINLVGGYHSHIQTKEGKITDGLSKDDVKHAIFQINHLKRDYWIEIILNLKNIKYKKPNDKGEFFIEYPKKLRVIARPNNFEGYNITLSAYKITQSKSKKPIIKELKIKKRKVKVTEIHNPH